ncbi:ADAMTS17 isoform 8, partial [Pan troglodytes]
GRPAELCFYSGRVLGHPGSLVSLSACGAAGGLVGLIQLGQEQVLIQPLNNSQGPFSGREHLIRRKWSLTPSPSAEAQRPEQLCKFLTVPQCLGLTWEDLKSGGWSDLEVPHSCVWPGGG